MTVADENILAAIATGTGCGIVIVDAADRIEYWSPQLEVVSGLTADQVVGQPWSELLLSSGLSEGGGDDADDELVDAATVLSGVAFYPEDADTADSGGRRVGILRLTSQCLDDVDNFPFAAETANGIPSRRAMFELIQSQIAFRVRYQTPFALLFLRIKNYQSFVDVLGSEVWDITNRLIFDQLSSIIRMADSVGLYDESTFWVVLANSTLSGARVAAEKIKRLGSSMKVDSLDIFLSVAVAGVVAHPGDNCDTMVDRGLAQIEKALESSSGLVVTE